VSAPRKIKTSFSKIPPEILSPNKGLLQPVAIPPEIDQPKAAARPLAFTLVAVGRPLKVTSVLPQHRKVIPLLHHPEEVIPVLLQLEEGTLEVDREAAATADLREADSRTRWGLNPLPSCTGLPSKQRIPDQETTIPA
jgi:hypothetical protein